MAQSWFNVLDVRPSEGKGLGIFASAAIPIGSIVLAERPSVSLAVGVPSDFDNVKSNVPHEQHVVSIMSQWRALEDDRRQQLEKLHVAYAAPAIQGIVESFRESHHSDAAGMACIADANTRMLAHPVLIFFNNAFGFRAEDGTRRLGLYRNLSQMNHSCEPNTIHEIDADGKMLCITIRDIAEDEEVVLSYIDTADTKAFRQRQFFFKWMFACTCRRCQYGDELPPVADIPGLGSYSAFDKTDHGVGKIKGVDITELWRWIQLRNQHIVAAQEKGAVPELYHLYREMAVALRKLGNTLQHMFYLDQSAMYWRNAARVAQRLYSGFPMLADACIVRATKQMQRLEVMQLVQTPQK